MGKSIGTKIIFKRNLPLGHHLKHGIAYVYHIYTFYINTVPKHLPLGHHLKHGIAYIYHIYTFYINTVPKYLPLGHHLKHGAVHVYHIYTFDIITVPKYLPLGHHLKHGVPTFTISTHLISPQSQKLTIRTPLEAWGTYVYHIYTFDSITVPKTYH